MRKAIIPTLVVKIQAQKVFPLGHILLNKSLARILMRCPTLNEHEPFYLM